MSKALILAGRLKPDARLGLALSEFAAALDEESRKVFVKMRSSPSGLGVIEPGGHWGRD
ncbi:hypothetical protein F5Y00DRAFT_261819 [Daldinia vernicosa]|uniref:uncharacterized protein n=1 Tax=Daldinia vernicosa TaxID=114800 RepID=UPI00200768E8|nr:uncharacterized protein F5Y00DRAFT_261819 [Daldinia vernicosa]KAI0849004.1 hypothetical protein F5Y00DRAFT_261819 [Daldinia vernicosa]